ncbi:hypothetical protein [Paraburkholderia sp. MM5482-R1]|uniref:hypothetical protein n=1 Tax=unclassified Paraburkholderia TaxID=2615204 RepID=UPI003D1A4BDF
MSPLTERTVATANYIHLFRHSNIATVVVQISIAMALIRQTDPLIFRIASRHFEMLSTFLLKEVCVGKGSIAWAYRLQNTPRTEAYVENAGLVLLRLAHVCIYVRSLEAQLVEMAFWHVCRLGHAPLFNGAARRLVALLASHRGFYVTGSCRFNRLVVLSRSHDASCAYHLAFSEQTQRAGEETFVWWLVRTTRRRMNNNQGHICAARQDLNNAIVQRSSSIFDSGFSAGVCMGPREAGGPALGGPRRPRSQIDRTG